MSQVMHCVECEERLSYISDHELENIEAYCIQCQDIRVFNKKLSVGNTH